MITADFSAGYNEITLPPIFQWDFGQKLLIKGANLPLVIQVHFWNKLLDTAKVRLAYIQDDGNSIVSIPDDLLQNDLDITAYIYVRSYDVAQYVSEETEGTFFIKNAEGAYIKVTLPAEYAAETTYYTESGYTEKKIRIPITARAKPDDFFEQEEPSDRQLVDEMFNFLQNFNTLIEAYKPARDYIVSVQNGEEKVPKAISADSAGNAEYATEAEISSTALNAEKVNGFEITKSKNGVLKIDGVIIPQKKLLKDFKGDPIIFKSTGQKAIYSDSVNGISSKTFEILIDASFYKFTLSSDMEEIFILHGEGTDGTATVFKITHSTTTLYIEMVRSNGGDNVLTKVYEIIEDETESSGGSSSGGEVEDGDSPSDSGDSGSEEGGDSSGGDSPSFETEDLPTIPEYPEEGADTGTESVVTILGNDPAFEDGLYEGVGFAIKSYVTPTAINGETSQYAVLRKGENFYLVSGRAINRVEIELNNGSNVKFDSSVPFYYSDGVWYEEGEDIGQGIILSLSDDNTRINERINSITIYFAEELANE